MENLVKRDIRYIFLGMPSIFSLQVFKGLLQAQLPPVAVWLPDYEVATTSALRRLNPDRAVSQLALVKPYMQDGIREIAWTNKIPIYAVSDLTDDETRNQLRKLKVDVGFVACFPKKIPAVLTSTAPFGFLNLHPSLLPAFRGPYPLFWQFREGIRNSGTTLHVIGESLDTGDIVLQQEIIIPDGVSGEEADRLFAAAGVELIVEALANMGQRKLTRRPQSADHATYQGRPTVKDFVIPVSWSAQRAFNFIRGVEMWQQPFMIHGSDFMLAVRSVLGHSQESINQPVVYLGKETKIRFSDGVLHVVNW